MIKKLAIFLILIVFICSGCSKPKKEPVPNTLETILKRGEIIVGVRADAYPFGYKDEEGIFICVDCRINLCPQHAKEHLENYQEHKFTYLMKN